MVATANSVNTVNYRAAVELLFELPCLRYCQQTTATMTTSATRTQTTTTITTITLKPDDGGDDVVVTICSSLADHSRRTLIDRFYTTVSVQTALLNKKNLININNRTKIEKNSNSFT